MEAIISVCDVGPKRYCATGKSADLAVHPCPLREMKRRRAASLTSAAVAIASLWGHCKPADACFLPHGCPWETSLSPRLVWSRRKSWTTRSNYYSPAQTESLCGTQRPVSDGTTTAGKATRQKEKHSSTASSKKQLKPNNCSAPLLYWKAPTDRVRCRLLSTDRSDSPSSALGDESEQVLEEVAGPRMLSFVVRGQPVPLRRHRTARGFTYNPSAGAQAAFRDVVETILLPRHVLSKERPFFSEGEHLAMSVVFRMRRPRSHFVGRKAGEGRLRKTAPPKLMVGRIDVDNLAKFILDSLNGLLYEDDRQVVSLTATKVYDCDGDCEGATEIAIRSVDDIEMDRFLGNHQRF